jgi:UDP-N-acetylglucosamine--N-acetylmuramyl-(pentapeptide) pyrophosphoryl-undecaprenol N-acetylglucosamine transferase
MANRWLARFVDDCWVVFTDARKFLKTTSLHQAGMPVRKEIEGMARPLEKKPDDGFHLLVVGGSQGARGINDAVCAMVKKLSERGEWDEGMHLVHQTGPSDYARLREAYGGLIHARVDLREYINDMGAEYARADLVISRSGTGTLSELAACGLPSILIPLPTAADDHQRKNAESLVKMGAAQLILQKDLNAEVLARAIGDLRRAPEKLKTMGDKARGFHHPQAAEKLVQEFMRRIDHASH